MAIRLTFKDSAGPRLIVCDSVNIDNGFIEAAWKLRDGSSHIRSFLTTEPIVVRRLYSGLQDVVGKPDAILHV